MREILFRAKRKATNDWVYGYFEKAYDDFQIYVSPKIITKYGSEYVREDTLGQYTGLTDKNGVKIFEGDIVEYETGKKCESAECSSRTFVQAFQSQPVRIAVPDSTTTYTITYGIETVSQLSATSTTTLS